MQPYFNLLKNQQKKLDLLCLFPQNFCCTKNGLFSASLSNLLSYSLSEADSVNSVSNQVLALFVEFIILVRSHNDDWVKLEQQLCFTIGKANKRHTRSGYVVTLSVPDTE